MLTQLTTVKARLGIPDTDTQYDALLTNFISAASAQFDRECRRTFAHNGSALQEFDANDTEIRVATYPVESVTKFELKTSEADGWVVQSDIDYILRRGGVISLATPVGRAGELGRVTYAGGYVLPGTTPGPGQVSLPSDLEQAAVEQVSFWHQNRDRLGINRIWEYHATYRQLLDVDLLRNVRTVLRKYERWTG